MFLQFWRYQRGSLYKRGTLIKKWYGMWREDVRMPDGSIQRHQRNVCLGPCQNCLLEAPRSHALQNV